MVSGFHKNKKLVGQFTHSIKAASASGTGGMLNERDERECSGGIKGKFNNDDWLLCYNVVNVVKGMR